MDELKGAGDRSLECLERHGHLRATKKQRYLITSTLNVFSAASGLKMNLDMSHMACSPNLDQRRQMELSRVSGFMRAANLEKDLGLPILKGGVT
ncbi:hypothetical protein RJT34_18832 [Clitoria ternatea]|uniref:Uncharacterized protein n=1 Tax=Clitoria ternatea TaxID=43366 RepID=A0AAN9IPW7_CLITE